jgi:hypothetical protein
MGPGVQEETRQAEKRDKGDNATSEEIIEAANLFKKLTVNNNRNSRSLPCSKYGAYSMEWATT